MPNISAIVNTHGIGEEQQPSGGVSPELEEPVVQRSRTLSDRPAEREHGRDSDPRPQQQRSAAGDPGHVSAAMPRM